ncbi:conserved hypothetical protein [uncultured Mycobacterium sp.]|uniref:Uncharacterized protein n=1 Tax=uncultured Mycobacterium sp. TaxID=171292 RepID=A0A1Y5P571_9MYCO|nr:conserved hypothetical protein [uncultured Mycobacterium sp.]
MDISTAAAPRSDQLNADDLIGGPQLVTITEVRKGNDEQPVEIVTAEFGPGRPYKPGKSMIRVLLAAWGKEASAYTGRRLMLYRDPEIRFGKDAVGGIRISAMSNIDSRLTLALTITRGKRAPFTVDPLPDEPKPADTPKLAAITADEALDFAREIAESNTLDELNAVGQAMTTCDLGSHKNKLQTAWRERSAAIKAAGVQDEQLPMNTTTNEEK